MPQRPTAVFLTDPLTCAGALGEARRIGLRVPEDLSVVGFDDGELRHDMVPQLTAVCQDTTALGREAVAMLQEVLASPSRNGGHARALRCWLEVHESTAAPPARAR
jgi:DNA-binding LacI/PurR family transcriptional regulator